MNIKNIEEYRYEVINFGSFSLIRDDTGTWYNNLEEFIDGVHISNSKKFEELYQEYLENKFYV